MKPTLFFLDGAVLAPGRVALAAQYNEHADVDASRVLLMLEDGWVSMDFDDDVIRSMTFSLVTGTLFMLGTSGVIYTVGGRAPAFTRASIKGTFSKQLLVDPEDRGELFRIRAIGGRVLACGLGGQLFELLDGTWRDLSLSGPIETCPDFEDVTIDAGGHPIAVGSKGAIYRLDPGGLQALDSPTNQHLSAIITGSRGKCFACGNAGVVLAIDGSTFEDLSVHLEPVRNLWAIAEYMGTLYTCEPARLLRYVDSADPAWVVEDVSANPAPSFYRLVSSAAELWSFGADHVFVKRGSTWTQLPVPGNEIPP